MTPAEIRALYVETLARAAYENRLRPWSVDPAWADLSEPRRQMYMHMGMQATDALAAVGLLPTETEWAAIGNHSDDDGWIMTDDIESREDAQRTAARWDGHVAVRHLTDWREVSE